MEGAPVAINTAISFIVHTLEDLSKNGYEMLNPLISKIESYHKEYRETGYINSLYKIVETITSYETYRDTLGYLFTKICESFFFIINFIRTKSSSLYDLMVLKLFELYQYFLKSNVKTYTKFTELNNIIEYIRNDIIGKNEKENMRENLTKMTYDDAVLKILISLLCPPEKKFGSFVEMIDGILLPDMNSLKNINSGFFDILNKVSSIGAENDDKETKKELSAVERLKLKKAQQKAKLEKCNEKIIDIESCSCIEGESIKSDENKVECNGIPEEIDQIHTMKSNTIIINQASSPEAVNVTRSPFKRMGSEEVVFTATVRSNNDPIVLLKSKLNFTPSPSPTIVKENHIETKSEKLHRILGKYSKLARIQVDKSPPKVEGINSMDKILSDRLLSDV